MRKLNTMKTKHSANKRWSNKIGNLISLGLILLLLFNPASKAWLLRQMMAMGLFNAKIDKEAPVANVPIGQEPFSFLDQKRKYNFGSEPERQGGFHYFLGYLVPALPGGNAFAK